MNASLSRRRFATYSGLLLIYNLAVIAWGVYVRASESGDGCGDTWPFCNGTKMPLEGPISKIVEATHRISTSLDGILVILMIIFAFRAFPKKHLVRLASTAAGVFTVVEALIGAVLVLKGLVTTNDSPLRAVVISIHVVSTFLLLGSMAVAALAVESPERPRFKGQGIAGWLLAMGALGLTMLAVSGSISALGHQLFDYSNVLAAALKPTTPWMVRMQPVHPLIAVTVGLYLTLMAGLVAHLRPDSMVEKAGKWVVGLFWFQAAIGVANILLKAPIAIQMTHLVVADVNWICLVVFGYLALRAGVPHREDEDEPISARALATDDEERVPVTQAYIALTKPRVISLLLFTALASAVAAKGAWPGSTVMVAVLIGGYLAAGAANAINMVIDRDIDRLMKRTAQRPTATQQISSHHALTFAFALATGSFIVLCSMANLLSAVMALSGLVFYVIVYTLMLKRKTWQNIVIGGAAGAFPPLVGWSAATGHLPSLALYLFAIIFVWTPVHFWALAILLKDDYAVAGIPMLPVVKGIRHTALQIVGYGLLTVAVTLVPLTLPEVGWIYGASAILLGLVLLGFCFILLRELGRKSASRLFHFSMLYLALLFLMLAIDRMVFISRHSSVAAAPIAASVSVR